MDEIKITPVLNTERVMKRKLGSIYEDSQDPLELNIKSMKLSEQKQATAKNIKYFDKCPSGVILLIFKYLNRKDKSSLNLFCREFYQLSHTSISILDFRNKGDIPPFILRKYLNNSINIEKLYFGKSNHFTQKNFLDDISLSIIYI